MSSSKTVIWRARGASRRELSEPHGVRVGAASSSAPPQTRSAVNVLGVRDLEENARPRTDPPPHLDAVDHVHLLRVGDLERRAANLEDRDSLTASPCR